MRLLVTGAAGFIGSWLCERLVARGDEVVGLDALDETLYPAADKRRNLARLLVEPSFRFVEGDFLDERLVDRLVAGRPDAIVHLGALAGVRTSLAQPRRYLRVNVEGTLNLLEAARAHGVTRFVFASTSSVYDPLPRDATPRPLREEDPALRSASPYGATKRAAELLCSTYSDVYGFDTACLRLFSVYGPRQRPDMAIHKFTRLLLDGRPIPIFGDGTSVRDYTYVDDVVDGLVAAIDRVGTLPGRHRVYNLGAGRTTTLARLVHLLELATGRSAILDRQPEQPGDVFATRADVSRAAAELGYAPKVTIDEGVPRFVEWFVGRDADARRAAS